MAMTQASALAALRETSTSLTVGSPLVIRLRGRYLEIWEKHSRTKLPVDYRALYEFACKLKWNAEKQRRLNL